MKIKTIRICVAAESRGNRHGFGARDYAVDAAALIQRSLDASGTSAWRPDSPNAAREEQAALADAEAQLAACDTMFRDLLRAEIVDLDVD